MKSLNFLQFVPKFLRPPWLLRRAAPPKPALSAEEKPREPRYVPLWVGGQVLPIFYDVQKSNRKRDPYD